MQNLWYICWHQCMIMIVTLFVIWYRSRGNKLHFRWFKCILGVFFRKIGKIVMQ